MCVGNPSCGDGVTDGEAQRRIGGDVVANVGRAGGGVILVHRQRIGGVEAGEGSIVVKAIVCSADGGLVAIGVEVARVAGVVEDRAKGSSARSAEVDDGGAGVGSVEDGVWAAVELKTIKRS